MFSLLPTHLPKRQPIRPKRPPKFWRFPLNTPLNTQLQDIEMRKKSTPINCKACGRKIWIMYSQSGNIVFSALKKNGGQSTSKNWIRHKVENPECTYNEKKVKSLLDLKMSLLRKMSLRFVLRIKNTAEAIVLRFVKIAMIYGKNWQTPTCHYRTRLSLE